MLGIHASNTTASLKTLLITVTNYETAVNHMAIISRLISRTLRPKQVTFWLPVTAYAF